MSGLVDNGAWLRKEARSVVDHLDSNRRAAPLSLEQTVLPKQLRSLAAVAPRPLQAGPRAAADEYRVKLVFLVAFQGFVTGGGGSRGG